MMSGYGLWYPLKGPESSSPFTHITCAVHLQDELVATEMVFAGLLSELSPAEAVALISALVFQVRAAGRKDRRREGGLISAWHLRWAIFTSRWLHLRQGRG